MTVPARAEAGIRILVTRAEGEWTPLRLALARSGVEVRFSSPIAQLPPEDPAPCREAMERLSGYAWWVFTSANGVRFFAEAAAAAGIDLGTFRVHRAAIGPATARALERRGLSVARVAADSRGEGMAELLRGTIGPGDRVLLVRPERSRPVVAEGLRATGATVDDVAFYRTVPSASAAALAAAIAEGAFGAVVFTSPSSFDALREAAPDPPAFEASLGALVKVAIGPTTAARLEEAGFRPEGVAREPSVNAVSRTLSVLLRSGSRLRRCATIRPQFRGIEPFLRRRRAEAPVSHEAPVRKTPLHAAHVAAGAKMVSFAGWEMPIQYTGVIDEHVAVRTRCGLFDVSHMGEVRVRGRDALRFLQYVTCNDVSRLIPGRIHYTGLMLPNGAFVDDLLVHKIADEEYFLVINAGNTPKDVAWLTQHAAAFDVEVAHESDAWGQIALQGPRAETILAGLTPHRLAEIPYYGFAFAEVDGAPCLVSRTGYTGEDGFEVYAPAAETERLWYALLAAGAPHGLVPTGLAARDTLRLEAKMALYGNDIDDTTTVLEADLGWIVKLGKGEFIGKDVLARQKAEGVSRKLVGFETEGRAVARHGFAAFRGDERVGTVTSGSFAPFLKKNVGLAYLPAGMWEPGTKFTVEIRGRREGAIVVPTPFYKRPR